MALCQRQDSGKRTSLPRGSDAPLRGTSVRVSEKRADAAVSQTSGAQRGHLQVVIVHGPGTMPFPAKADTGRAYRMRE